MCNGALIDKSANEAWTFLTEVAEKTQQWESIREPNKTTPVVNIHRIEFDFERNAKIASLARRIEAIELQQNASTSVCNESSYNQVNDVTTLRIEKESEQDSDSKNSTDVNVPMPCCVPVAPFPQRLVHQKGGNQYNDILEMLKRVNINISFLEEIRRIPTYAKFLKDLCTQKRKLHVHTRAFLTEQVRFIIQNKIPTKFRDPGCPTISCTIGDHEVEKALLDLGTSVNLLPYSVYVQLGLGELKSTPVTLQLADRSVRIPRGIVEDVLINVDKFFFPMDFIVLDTQPVQNPDNHILVILGQLNVFNISQHPIDCDDNELHEINMIESLIQDSLPDILSVDPLQACLDNFDLDIFDSEYISEV
ncbi:uncharacterized protein LOC113312765 [Papaver somniferum]|uniref:uncharacterized protein LOC113312765 n=1 Tax=Papaver somniferum TaxID=3469 RepID=UPI000E6FF62B|nr:uncharacterized protein LOC113312765 [Papaver somniferum]